MRCVTKKMKTLFCNLLNCQETVRIKHIFSSKSITSFCKHEPFVFIAEWSGAFSPKILGTHLNQDFGGNPFQKRENLVLKWIPSADEHIQDFAKRNFWSNLYKIVKKLRLPKSAGYIIIICLLYNIHKLI